MPTSDEIDRLNLLLERRAATINMLRAAVELHQHVQDSRFHEVDVCGECWKEWPCPTVRMTGEEP